MNKVLIVGLGNPGLAYEATRHNMGHAIVRALAKDLGWAWKRDSHVKGEYAIGEKDQKEVTLLVPTTFMNNSGLAVSRMMQILQIESKDLLVVVDDVYIPFGQFRLREKGSSAGHNGVKSIIDHIVTDDFQRLKVGVGAPHMGHLEEFVLGQYTEEEMRHLPEIVGCGHAIIDLWIKGDLGRAKEVASTTSIDKENRE